MNYIYIYIFNANGQINSPVRLCKVFANCGPNEILDTRKEEIGRKAEAPET
jgi:hypothetical protein